MRTFLLLISLFLTDASICLTQTIEFSNKLDKVAAIKGDTIVIAVDTAFVLNKSRAKWLNYQLDELQYIKSSYSCLKSDHTVLINDINAIQKQLNKLLNNSIQDSIIITKNLDRIISDLETTLAEFKNNNESLKATNADLNKQISNLEKIIKDLKKESRWIWRNAVVDKLVVLAGGLGVGILIGLAI